MKYKIATIGDCVKDIFVFAQTRLLSSGKFMGRRKLYLCLPYGHKMKMDGVDYDLGGSACNSATCFSRAGIKTAFSTVVGDDIYSKEALEILGKEKVGTSYIVKEKGNSLGFSIILTGPTGDRSILTHRVKNNFSKVNISKIFKNCDVVYIAGINRYSKVLQKKIIYYIKKTKKPLYINPSSFQLNRSLTILKKIIRNSEAVCLNLVEALILVKRKKIKAKELLERIRKMGTKMVIITMGPKGSLFYDGENFYKTGIYKTKKVDSTGSGDTFFATFVAAQIRGENIEDSLKLSAINAGATVSLFGAQKGLLRWRELKRRLKENKVVVRKF